MKTKKNGPVSIILLFALIVIISGCNMTISIEDVKDSDHVGKTVTISGTVQDTIKLGELSGYTIKDATGTMGISSQSLPKEGTNIRVTGTLVKDTLPGYYIKAD